MLSRLATMIAGVRGAASALVAAAAILAMQGCAGPGFYATTLNAPDGIGPGDPVVHAGATIGHVTRVSPPVAGDSAVDVEIDPQHTGAIHQDTIMQLSGAGVAPSLEVVNPDPESADAQNGALLFGASNQSQTQLLMTSLGPPSFVGKYANFFQGLSNSTPGAQPPAANTALANQLLAIMRATMGAAAVATAANPATRAQTDQFRIDAAAVERQLIAHDRGADAARLRSEVERLNAAAAAVSAPSGTATIPRAYPGP